MKRIAIVDDEPDITNVLKKGLERNGFTVDTFNDPQAALASIPPRYYDLVIIDIRMPRINGFDLYRQLKKRDSAVKVCFLTSFQIYCEEFRMLFPKIDVKAFNRKPVRISNLVNQINAAITSK
jgi:two-component system, OmpR family, response regulator ChvI